MPEPRSAAMRIEKLELAHQPTELECSESFDQVAKLEAVFRKHNWNIDKEIGLLISMAKDKKANKRDRQTALQMIERRRLHVLRMSGNLAVVTATQTETTSNKELEQVRTITRQIQAQVNMPVRRPTNDTDAHSTPGYGGPFGDIFHTPETQEAEGAEAQIPESAPLPTWTVRSVEETSGREGSNGSEYDTYSSDTGHIEGRDPYFDGPDAAGVCDSELCEPAPVATGDSQCVEATLVVDQPLPQDGSGGPQTA